MIHAVYIVSRIQIAASSFILKKAVAIDTNSLVALRATKLLLTAMLIHYELLANWLNNEKGYDIRGYRKWENFGTEKIGKFGES